MKKKSLITLLLALIITLTGCGKSEKETNEEGYTQEDIDTFITECVEKYPELTEQIRAILSEETTKSLEGYKNEITNLQLEIDALERRKAELQNVETFKLKDLIVIKHFNDITGEEDLYILTTVNSPIHREYHSLFKAWFNLHGGKECTNQQEFCPEYVHFTEYEFLFDYLTEEELELVKANGGYIDTLTLDKILERIRSEYKAATEEQGKGKTLTNNG